MEKMIERIDTLEIKMREVISKDSQILDQLTDLFSDIEIEDDQFVDFSIRTLLEFYSTLFVTKIESEIFDKAKSHEEAGNYKEFINELMDLYSVLYITLNVTCKDLKGLYRKINIPLSYPLPLTVSTILASINVKNNYSVELIDSEDTSFKFIDDEEENDTLLNISNYPTTILSVMQKAKLIYGVKEKWEFEILAGKIFEDIDADGDAKIIKADGAGIFEEQKKELIDALNGKNDELFKIFNDVNLDKLNDDLFNKSVEIFNRYVEN